VPKIPVAFPTEKDPNAGQIQHTVDGFRSNKPSERLCQVTSILYIEAIMGCLFGRSMTVLTINWRQTIVIISTLAVLTVYMR
jgi:hypothetical protein